MRIHDSGRILLVCQTHTFVEVLADCFVGGCGKGYNGV